jgi:hypothetical protein
MIGGQQFDFEKFRSHQTNTRKYEEEFADFFFEDLGA